LIDRVCVYDVGRRVVVADSRSSDPETMLILGNIQGQTDGIDLSIPQQLTLSLIRSFNLKGPFVVRLLDRSSRIVKSLPFLDSTTIPLTDDGETVTN